MNYIYLYFIIGLIQTTIILIAYCIEETKQGDIELSLGDIFSLFLIFTFWPITTITLIISLIKHFKKQDDGE